MNNEQPDFIVSCDGSDITKYTESWELNDIEDGISNLVVTIINEDFKFSGKFKIGSKLKITFGYRGNMPSTVSMDVKEYSENYTTKGLRCIIKGMDAASDLVGHSARANFDSPEVKKIIEEIAKMSKLQVEGLDKVKGAPIQDGNRHGGHNERFNALMRRLMQLLTPQKKGGGSSVGKMGSAKKGVKSRPAPQKGSGVHGKVANGALAGRGGAVHAEVKADDTCNVAYNMLKQMSDSASSLTIRAKMEAVGYPLLKAKKCLTINNVGPVASGKWYVKGVTHEWSTNSGYRTRADLLREELGKDDAGGDKEQPLVMHANIYKERTLYVGLREMNGDSQATFTFGTGPKNVIAFKWTEHLEGGLEAGESSADKNINLDDPNPKKNQSKQSGSGYTPSAFGM